MTNATPKNIRLRDAIKRVEGAFPKHQADAILGFAEALAPEAQPRDNEPAPAERQTALRTPTPEPFRDLLAAWNARLVGGEMNEREKSGLRACVSNLKDAITRAQAGNG